MGAVCYADDIALLAPSPSALRQMLTTCSSFATSHRILLCLITIALAPTLSKVFEWCVLIEYRSAFVTSPLQFGFKQGFSTDLCTGLILNVVARYNVNNTDVYGCFLDASKALD